MKRVKPTILPEAETAGARPSRLLAGLLLSFALHAAALLAWRQGKPAQAPVEAARAAIAVRLRPPPPPPAPPPRAEPAPPSASAAKPASAARPKRRVAPAVIALPAQAAPAPPDTFTVEPAEPSAPPRFDLDAARKLARRLADEPDPAKAGTALAQFPAKPLETETKAARAISRAKRRDCKDGIPGGLLAPLYLMMDKKDSGCKW